MLAAIRRPADDDGESEGKAIVGNAAPSREGEALGAAIAVSREAVSEDARRDRSPTVLPRSGTRDCNTYTHATPF